MAKSKKMKIIYEDRNLLVIDKPANFLTIATDKEKIHTLYHEAREYVKKQNPKNKIFIVHRLDKDTSGIVLFVKNEKLKNYLQNTWSKRAFIREYLAIVEGKVPKKEDTIKSYLKEDKTFKVYTSTSGNLAITHYETLASTKAYSLLKINIYTGKKNQIRVQLSDIGHPIIGDKKYGATKNPLGRLALHATKLGIDFSEEKITWQSTPPKCFQNIFEREVIEYEKNFND